MRTFRILLLIVVGVFFYIFHCIEAGVTPSYVNPYDPYAVKYPPVREGTAVSVTKPPGAPADSPEGGYGSWKPQSGVGYGSWRPQPGGGYGNWRSTPFGGYGSWRPPPIGSYGSWKPQPGGGYGSWKSQPGGGYGSWRPQPGGGYGSWGLPPGVGYGFGKPPPGTDDGTYKQQSSEDDGEYSGDGDDESDGSENNGPGGSAGQKVGKANSIGVGGRAGDAGRLNAGGSGGKGADNQEGVAGPAKTAGEVSPETGSNKAEGEADFGGSGAKHIKGHIDAGIASHVEVAPLVGSSGGVSEVGNNVAVGEAGAEELNTGGSADTGESSNVAEEESGGATTDSNGKEEETSTKLDGEEYIRSQLRFGVSVGEETYKVAGVASEGKIEAGAIPQDDEGQEAVGVAEEPSANQVVVGADSSRADEETSGGNAEAGSSESQKDARVEVNEGDNLLGGPEKNVGLLDDGVGIQKEVEPVGLSNFDVGSNIAGGELGAVVLGIEGSEIQQATGSAGNSGLGTEPSGGERGVSEGEVADVASSNEVEGQTETDELGLDGVVDIVRSSRSLERSGGSEGKGSNGGAGGSGGQGGIERGSSGGAGGSDGKRGRPETGGGAGTEGTGTTGGSGNQGGIGAATSGGAGVDARRRRRCAESEGRGKSDEEEIDGEGSENAMIVNIN